MGSLVPWDGGFGLVQGDAFGLVNDAEGAWEFCFGKGVGGFLAGDIVVAGTGSKLPLLARSFFMGLSEGTSEAPLLDIVSGFSLIFTNGAQNYKLSAQNWAKRRAKKSESTFL